MDSIIKSSFWTDARVEESTAEVKLACVWLISNPSRDLCGFTTVSNKRFEFETGLPASALEGASMGLPSSITKLPGGVWFMRNFLRHQFGKGGKLSLGNKVVIAAARHAAKLPEPLRRAFFEAYPELVDLAGNSPKTAGGNNPPSIPHTENRDGVRVRVREGEEYKEGCGEETRGVEVDPVAIVQAYPRRQGDKQALEAVLASIRKGASPEAMLAGTLAIAAEVAMLPSGPLNTYVPSADRFFRDERWRDDPLTWQRQGTARNGAQAGKLNLGGRKAEPIKTT